MLTPDYLEHVADDIIEVYAELERSIIKNIARRLTKTNLLIPSINHQVKVLQESGMLYNDIIKEVSKITGKSQSTINKIFKNSAMQSIKLDNNIYKMAGFNPISIIQSEPMLQFLVAGMNKTNSDLNNLTMTIAGNAQAKFTNAVNLAYMQVTSGAFDRNTAILNATKILSDDGIDIVYPSGRVSKVDVAVRRAVVTGVNQTCAKMQDMLADEFECDLMELTAHPGARITDKNDYTNHAWWQGKIVSRSGRKGYLSLEDIGYMLITGFLGANCRHGWSPFFEGIMKRRYTDEELANINNQTVKYKGNDLGLYEATEMQRNKERSIRKLKREAGAYEDILKNSDDEELKRLTSIKYNDTKSKLSKAQKDLKDFTEETDLKRDYTRERVYKNTYSENTFKEDNKIQSSNNDITEYGTSQILTKDVENVCNEVYNRYNKNGYENIALVDTKTGKALGGINTDYNKSNVNLSSFQKELSRTYEDRSLLLIHNHPNNTPFSIDDIVEMVKNKKLSSLVVVTKDYNYFLEPLLKDLKNINIIELEKNIRGYIDSMIVELYNSTGKLADSNNVNDFYKNIFKLKGWSYGRKRRIP